MNQKKILIIVGLILCVVAIGVIIFAVSNSKGNVIYSNTFYFSMGSRRLKIYDNGDVYDDLEIEEPNHKENYKKIKTLNSIEIKELKSKIENEADKTILEDYVKKLIYGSTDVNPMSFNLK